MSLSFYPTSPPPDLVKGLGMAHQKTSSSIRRIRYACMKNMCRLLTTFLMARTNVLCFKTLFMVLKSCVRLEYTADNFATSNGSKFNMINKSIYYFLVLLFMMPYLGNRKQRNKYYIMPLRISTLKQLKIWSLMTLIAQFAVCKHMYPTFVLNHHILLKVMQLLSEYPLISCLALIIKTRQRQTVWMTKLNPTYLAILRHPHFLVFLPIGRHLVCLHSNIRLIFIRYQHTTATYLLICMTKTLST